MKFEFYRPLNIILFVTEVLCLESEMPTHQAYVYLDTGSPAGGGSVFGLLWSLWDMGPNW